jgi:hypothetical protein
MSDEAEDTSDEQQSRDEIYGERAQSLVTFVKSSKPPVKRGTLGHFAMGKNWQPETLQLVLDYCLEQKLLTSYTSFSGVTAYKLPFTPVHEDEDEVATESTAGAVRAQRHDSEARTAPAVNYGCPEHGAARSGAEENTMAKEWVTTKEAAELLGMSLNGTTGLGRKGKIESKADGNGSRAPRLFKRASVIAFRDTKRGFKAAQSNTDLLDTPPQRRTKQIIAKASRAPKVQTSTAPAELASDVRALVHCVRRGWLTPGELLTQLEKLVA